MKKFWARIFIISLLMVASVISLDYVSAAAPTTANSSGLNTSLLEQTKIGDTLGGKGFNVGQFIGKTVTYLLGFLSMVFVLLIIWAGAQWMTAGGDEKKIETAKTTIRNSIIGVIIIIASYAITVFVFNMVGEWLGGGTGGGAPAASPTPVGTPPATGISG